MIPGEWNAAAGRSGSDSPAVRLRRTAAFSESASMQGRHSREEYGVSGIQYGAFRPNRSFPTGIGTRKALRISSIHAHSELSLCARRREHSAQTTVADLRTEIVRRPPRPKGVPYVYGAEPPPDAVDCSGFVQYVYRKAAGLEIPRNSRQQWAFGYPIKMSEIRPGRCLRVSTRAGAAPATWPSTSARAPMIQAASEGPETGVMVSSTSDRMGRPPPGRAFIPRQARRRGKTREGLSACQTAAAPMTAPMTLSVPKQGQPAAVASSTAPGACSCAQANGFGLCSGLRDRLRLGPSSLPWLPNRVPAAAGSMLAFTITNGREQRKLPDRLLQGNLDTRKSSP